MGPLNEGPTPHKLLPHATEPELMATVFVFSVQND